MLIIGLWNIYQKTQGGIVRGGPSWQTKGSRLDDLTISIGDPQSFRRD
jgi:hypothetical protein